MRPLSYFKTRAIKLEKMIKQATEDLQGAEHDLKENPNKETWEALVGIEKKISILESEKVGVLDTITNYEQYCYFEEQEELLTAMTQESYAYC